MYKESQGMNSFFGSFLYDQLIPSNHFLKKVASTIDFSFINDLCKDVYHQEGAGQKPYAPAFLFKVLFLAFTYNISDREIEEQINDRISFKWFLNLAVDESAPDHSTLTIFRERLSNDRFRSIFNRIVAIAQEKGLTDDKLKVIDATHLEADVNRFKILEKRENMNEPSWQSSPDPDARFGYKSKTKPFYGYKSHELIDAKAGIVEDIEVTPGNTHDQTCFPRLTKYLKLHTAITGDQAYETDDNEMFCIIKNIVPYLAIKSYRKDPYKEIRKQEPRYQAAMTLRRIYERTFGEAKQHHGMRRCRWRTQWKVEIQCLLTATIQNIKRIVAHAHDPPRLHPLYAAYFS